ncbi:hypothetical protein [Trichlorobacter lovleyi]|uniref:hypothetical protein n=1 Tax=Trichlorobacter lovleyi TaxID=313985 RepID=UPI003D13A6F1
MPNYKNIISFLNDLEAEDLRSHERQIQQAKLRPLLAKGHILAQAGCPDRAEEYRNKADQILQRLQP